MSTEPSSLISWSIVSPETVPVPVPAPVAVKIVLTLLFAAPIEVKEVFPGDTILYELPMLKDPAVIVLANVGVVGVVEFLSFLVLKLPAVVLPAVA